MRFTVELINRSSAAIESRAKFRRVDRTVRREMTFDSNPGIARLDATYPCRRDQFRMLYLLLGDPNFPSPPVVCLTGFPKGGKRSCARAFLKETSTTHIWIDCLETLSPALFFTKLVNELRRLEDPKSPRIRLNADTTSSVGAVREALQSLNGKIVLVRLLWCTQLIIRLLRILDV